MTVQTHGRKTSSPLPGLKLYNTNRHVLALLAEFFCLRTNDVAELMRGRTPTDSDKRSIRQTLSVLLSAGVVSRLPYLDLDRVTGGVHYAWGLSDKGVQFCKSLWPRCKTFDEHSQRTLDHELEISSFHMALKRFALKHKLQLYWQQADLKCTVSPDAMFALTDLTKPEDKSTFYYFLEIERAKIGHYQNGEPSIMKKLGKYHEYYGSDACQKEWGTFRQFRVIVVQRTDERRENLLKQLNQEYNHRMFWLANEASCKTDISGEIFRTPRDWEKVGYSFLQA